MDLTTLEGRRYYQSKYQTTLLDDVIPFWLKHSIDRQCGGVITSLDRDGAILDTDKSIWFQGRAAWMFSSLYSDVAQQPEWLAVAESCLEFLGKSAVGSQGKLYFSVTRDGQPLRMRRYVFSEAFASIAYAKHFQATGLEESRELALHYFEQYRKYSFEPGWIEPKVDPKSRPMQGLSPWMIAIVTCQQLRSCVGEFDQKGKSFSERIDSFIAKIRTDFLKPEHQCLMEVVGEHGEVLDHFDGRLLNPGHAIEAAWFIMLEGAIRQDRSYIELGTTILDWMWERGWDREYGGILYFRDLMEKPIQEYWHDMKFWWPHCETIIATLLAFQLTGNTRYAQWHKLVHDWSFEHFADPVHGEWYGYLHRDGRISVPLKGNLWKGPFHLPRMLLTCWKLLENPPQGAF